MAKLNSAQWRETIDWFCLKPCLTLIACNLLLVGRFWQSIYVLGSTQTLRCADCNTDSKILLWWPDNRCLESEMHQPEAFQLPCIHEASHAIRRITTLTLLKYTHFFISCQASSEARHFVQCNQSQSNEIGTCLLPIYSPCGCWKAITRQLQFKARWEATPIGSCHNHSKSLLNLKCKSLRNICEQHIHKLKKSFQKPEKTVRRNCLHLLRLEGYPWSTTLVCHCGPFHKRQNGLENHNRSKHPINMTLSRLSKQDPL